MPLSDRQCKQAKAKTKDYKLSDGNGLYLLVTKEGNKYWRYKYRFLGKEKLLALGVYPEVSLAEVREVHRKAHKQVTEGVDPSLQRKKIKQQAMQDSANTFRAIALEWHDHSREKWSEDHAARLHQRLEKELFPALGDLPLKEIDAPILLRAIRDIEKRGAHEVARRALQLAGQVFRYAIITGRGTRDISADLKGALKPTKRGHYHALDSRDLPKFLRDLRANEARLYLQTKLAIELLMLTFVRTSELIKARWEEFDLPEKIWVIPAERMKMRRDHLVPLSKQALAVLYRLQEINGHRDHVFPGQRTPRAPMSNNTILMALDRMGYRGKHTGHGFRALAMSTIKEKLGYRHEIIDRQLAHAHKKQVDAAYDRAQFLEDRTEMMQDWADYLDGIG